MKFLERLSLSQSTEYRIACDEDALLALSEALLAALPQNPSYDVVALELAQILDQVKGDDFRKFRKLSHKLKKLAGKSK